MGVGDIIGLGHFANSSTDRSFVVTRSYSLEVVIPGFVEVVTRKAAATAPSGFELRSSATVRLAFLFRRAFLCPVPLYVPRAASFFALLGGNVALAPSPPSPLPRALGRFKSPSSATVCDSSPSPDSGGTLRLYPPWRVGLVVRTRTVQRCLTGGLPNTSNVGLVPAS